jgi:hypothetical protein
MSKTTKVKIGSCGVDSGQLLIIDPCYLSNWKDGEFPSKDGNDYNAVSELTIGNKFGEHKGGVVSETGYGDGRYPVIATIADEGKWGKRIKKIEIKFF